MSYKILPTEKFVKDFKKLDRNLQRKIKNKIGSTCDIIFGDRRYTDISIPVPGIHQTINCACAIGTAEIASNSLPEKFKIKLLGEKGFKTVRNGVKNVNCPGRVEIANFKSRGQGGVSEAINMAQRVKVTDDRLRIRLLNHASQAAPSRNLCNNKAIFFRGSERCALKHLDRIGDVFNDTPKRDDLII